MIYILLLGAFFAFKTAHKYNLFIPLKYLGKLLKVSTHWNKVGCMDHAIRIGDATNHKGEFLNKTHESSSAAHAGFLFGRAWKGQ